jgi:hypothetical protein
VDNEIKERLAKQCARMFLQQMGAASVPADVQLMALEMAAKAVFTTSVVHAKRLELLDKWLKQIRIGVKAEMQKGKINVRNH